MTIRKNLKINYLEQIFFFNFNNNLFYPGSSMKRVQRVFEPCVTQTQCHYFLKFYSYEEFCISRIENWITPSNFPQVYLYLLSLLVLMENYKMFL